MNITSEMLAEMMKRGMILVNGPLIINNIDAYNVAVNNGSIDEYAPVLPSERHTTQQYPSWYTQDQIAQHERENVRRIEASRDADLQIAKQELYAQQDEANYWRRMYEASLLK